MDLSVASRVGLRKQERFWGLRALRPLAECSEAQAEGVVGQMTEVSAGGGFAVAEAVPVAPLAGEIVEFQQAVRESGSSRPRAGGSG